MHRILVLATGAITGLSACARPAGIVPGPSAKTQAADALEERAVVDAERGWVKAAIAGDADAFGRFMAGEYVAQGPKGKLLTKTAWVERMRQGKSKFQVVNFCNMIVRVSGDAAVVTADYAQIATSDGKDTSGKGSETDFWVKRGGRWLVLGSAFAASSPECSA